MKEKLLKIISPIFVIIMLVFPNMLYSQSNLKGKDKIEYKKLKSINFESYVGKTVDTLLQQKGIKSFKSYFWADEPPGKLSALCLRYTSQVYLKIYVKDFQFLTRFSKERDWDLGLFKKEKISKIQIYIE